METWGYCQPCTRWFYCPKWFDKMAPQPVCPACGSEPTAIQNRAAHAVPVAPPAQASGSNGTVQRSPVRDAEPRTEIRGLCPKCDTWFCCDDWFDQSVPLPCCPECRLPPARLQYHWWAADSRPGVVGAAAGTSDLWIG